MYSRYEMSPHISDVDDNNYIVLSLMLNKYSKSLDLKRREVLWKLPYG